MPGSYCAGKFPGLGPLCGTTLTSEPHFRPESSLTLWEYVVNCQVSCLPCVEYYLIYSLCVNELELLLKFALEIALSFPFVSSGLLSGST